MLDEKLVHTLINTGDKKDLWLKRLSFTSILVSSNLLQTMMTKTLEGLTSKQWLLLIITSSLSEPPTLSEIGKYMGCSRQNVKQIAKILVKENYLSFTKSESDKNAVRLVPTEKWKNFCEKYDTYTNSILEEIFEEFTTEQLQQYLDSYTKITQNIEKINEKLTLPI